MARTATFGEVETRIRRDLLNDNDPDQYRWSPAAVLARMNESVVDVATRYNGWAAYDQETGARIYSIFTKDIASACDVAPGGTQPTDQQIAAFRAKRLPIDEKWADAVAYLAAAKLLESDDSDVANAQRAGVFIQKGMELAAR